MKNKLILFCISLGLSIFCFSQNTNEKKSKFFSSAGYGLAGSFFVRSYDEFAPIPRYKTFYKKNFLGVCQNIAVGVNVKRNYQIKIGLNFQHFTRRIKTKDTLSSVIINLDHTIHHRDYMWYAGINKILKTKNMFFHPGLAFIICDQNRKK